VKTDQTGTAFFLLVLIVLTWLYIDGRIAAAAQALAGKKVLA
jgi:hypothetical protein